MISILLMLAALSTASSAAAPSAMDAAVSSAAAQGFAGEILVGDTTRTLYDRAVSEPGRPHKPGETWRWASVTKQLTATLVLREVESGRLSLDDTLAQRLPGFKGPNASRITLRMLLQHSSGLANPDDTAIGALGAMPDFYRRGTAGAGGVADALGYCAGPAKSEPGVGFSYNNCDYILLGAVLERATGRPFAGLLRERIARPLGLKSLRLAETGVRHPPMVAGRLAGGDPEPAFELATFGASGAAYGRPADLMAFDRALLNHRLLSAATSDLAWAGDPSLGYEALGVWSFPARLKGCAGPVQLVERRGEIGGIEVRNLLAPGLGRALVVFADRAELPFGEVWRGQGLTYDLASAAFCAVDNP